MNAQNPVQAAATLIAVALCCGSPYASAQAPPTEPSPAEWPPGVRYFIPDSASDEARALYRRLMPLVAKGRGAQKPPQTLEEFDARRAAGIAGAEPKNAALLKKLNVTATDAKLGSVGVVEVRPPHYRDDGTVLIYVHGGGFVNDSARSALGGVALMSAATGKRIVSVDYTVAPRGKWPRVTDEVISVYQALLAEGYRAGNIGLFGDSAGGNIVAASVLKLRDRKIEMPGALILLSPATDLAQAGDTYTTLRDADPVLDAPDLVPAFEAYATRADWKNPYVSPVYGDFSKGFPPTLIQVGTKELLLSDSVRLYQTIKTAGGTAQLDVYEGMSHVFQSYMTDTPEQKAAYAEARSFWLKHLPARKAPGPDAAANPS